MNKLDTDYQNLLKDILANGVKKDDRTGTGTISVFGRQIRHNMKDGFPLLTTKKMAVKSVMTELKWFLKGDTNIKYLVNNGCNIWNGDAFKNYCRKQAPHDHFETQEEFIQQIKTNDEFAKKWGELGPIYGYQWRHWVAKNEIESGGEYAWVDQIEWLINELKTNPDSRRLMVNAWNVGDMSEMVLPPCHYGFQCYVSDGKLSLMWNQRSVDVPLGLPFNIASYGMLLHLLADEVNMEPGELIANLGDCHIYNNQIKGVKEQIHRAPYGLPALTKLNNVDILNGEFDYTIEYYESHPRISFPLSN
jgi:thymidylate synthase